MGVTGQPRGGDLLAASQRFEKQPGFLSRLLAPGFHKLIDRMDAGLEKGSVLGRLPDGSTRLIGGRGPGFEAEVSIHNWRALMRVATGGSVVGRGAAQAPEAGRAPASCSTASTRWAPTASTFESGMFFFKPPLFEKQRGALKGCVCVYGKGWVL